jgi:peroxiredoxin
MCINKCYDDTTKIKFAITFFFIFIAFTSLAQKTKYVKPLRTASSILNSPESLMNYLDNVDLSHNFTGLDTTGNIISKEAFLKILSSGEYIPLKLVSQDNSDYYELYKCMTSDEKDPRNLVLNIFIKSYGATEYNKYKMIGAPFPAFNFTDLGGHIYSSENTKGKIVVLKCWLIQCKPCVEEMPELNKIVKQYEKRKDIVFLSLSFDSQEELKKFLMKTPFSYPVVAGQQNYLSEILKVTSYPTHIVINKQGNVVLISNDYKEMSSAVKVEASK